MKRILIVEDEQAIREFEVINLNRVGYDTVETDNGEDAIRVFAASPSDYQIVLLDVALPGMDGFAVCKEIRRMSGTVGIIMLTARAQEIDKVNGLMIGADDYITKPFSPSELIARIDSLSRRVDLISGNKAANSTDEIRINEFVLNPRRRTLTKKGVNVELTQVEFQMLEYFFTNPDTVLQRNDILDRVWGESYSGEDKIVDVNIRRLRMKLEDNPGAPVHLITVWGAGYKWATTE